MEEKFIIKVRCSHCGYEDVLASEEDRSIPMFFDTIDAANKHISLLGKKPLKADNAAAAGKTTDYECPKCRAILPMHFLSMNVFRHP